MAKVRIPTVLRPLAEGTATIELAAPTFGALREGIRARYPALADRLYDEGGRVREFVSVFVEGEDARELTDDAPLGERSDIVLLPAISGGSCGTPRASTRRPHIQFRANESDSRGASS